MSILVKCMEMPTTCGKCRIKNAIECDKWKLVRSIALDRHRDCPLVPVPEPHGDLIDAQEQMCLMQSCDYDTYNDYNRAFDMLDNAPTIIPASKED